MCRPLWLTAFVDVPAAHHEAAGRFWSAVTGWPLSIPRGDAGEFATLVPPSGDPHLKVQRTGAERAGTHLDVHVEDPEAAYRQAAELGARLVGRPVGEDYVVVSSPGGFTFCLVRERRSRPAQPMTWPGGHSSIVDQLCLDVPSSAFAREARFWADVTGWELGRSTVREEFAHLRRPSGFALRILLQRLDERDGVVRGHLDLATTDRQAEVRRHEALGASRAAPQPGPHWTVMCDPSGASYCITDRDPASGRLRPGPVTP